MEKTIEKVCGKWEQDQYAMYLRKSRADMEMEALGEGETLARHKHMLEALAAKHDIHPGQITVYKEVVSGDSIDQRPEMQRLLSDIYQHKYKAVLVVEVERLARGNTKDQGEVADAFQASSTKIITPAKVYDPNNEFDQEYFEFGLFMSRREYKTIKRRLEAGKKQSVMEGNYLPPQRIFGFNIVKPSKKDRYLVENQEEGPILRMIFDWYTEEKRSQYWIARKLTEMGVKTTRNRDEWSKGTIRDMLSNVHYIGKVSWGAQQTVKVFDEKKGKLVKKRQKGQVEYYEGKHEGLISEEQFEKAQMILKQKKPKANMQKELANPLAGLLECCDCGRNMSLLDYNKYPSRQKYNYQPRFIHARMFSCKKKSCDVQTVMDAFVEALNAYIDDFTFKMENDNDQTDLIRHQDMIKAMEKELAKQEKKKRKLFDSWEADDGTYTRDEFIERKQMYVHQIDELNDRIKEAKENMPKPVNYSKKIVSLHKMIDCINNPKLSAKKKNDFLKQYIDKITYDIIDHGERKGGTPILEVFLK